MATFGLGGSGTICAGNLDPRPFRGEKEGGGGREREREIGRESGREREREGRGRKGRQHAVSPSLLISDGGDGKSHP